MEQEKKVKRLTQTEKIALAIKAALAAEKQGADPMQAALAALPKSESEKIDRAALQAKVNAKIDAAPMPATDAVFAALANIEGLVKSAIAEQDNVLADLYATLTADEKSLCKIAARMTLATPENGNKSDYARLGVVVPARKPIEHDDTFRRADGFVLVANADKLAKDEKDADKVKWLDALRAYPQGTIFHNKTLREIDARVFNNPDKGQNYGSGSKSMTWLEPYYKPEVSPDGQARIDKAQTALKDAEKNAVK